MFALLKVFGSPEHVERVRSKYLATNAGFGYGHAKLELLDALNEYLQPYRERRQALLNNPELVQVKLAEGARIMNERLEAKMRKIRELTGIV